ncbi:hypothetical protein D3C87_1553560 [compost metagenome]
MSQWRASQRIKLLLAVFDDLNLFATNHLATLQTGQDVRHTHVREDLVVHAPWARRIFVERLQVTVEPVGAANTGNQGQVRRRCAKPGLGVRWLHADAHVVADLGASEHQLLQHQLMGNAQVIGNTLIALELGTVATHAVVGERTRAILHGCVIGNVDVDFFQLGATVFGCESKHWQRSKHQYSK